jgi:hypothetical protein
MRELDLRLPFTFTTGFIPVTRSVNIYVSCGHLGSLPTAAARLAFPDSNPGSEFFSSQKKKKQPPLFQISRVTSCFEFSRDS